MPGSLGRRHSPCATWMLSARSRSRSSTCSKKRRPTMPRGPVRRGQLISPFGPGAMMILPDGVSVICGGLDYWFKHESGDTGTIDQQEYQVDEWRLAGRLNVAHF